jgi:hypothetical protein
MKYAEFKIIEGYPEVTQKFSQEADAQAIQQAIEVYRDLVNRNQVQGNERNIDWWGKQGWEKFRTFVNAKSQQKSQTQRKNKTAPGKSHTLAETDDWLIVIPLDKDASCFHGKDTSWCTTKSDAGHYESYFRDSSITLIYFMQKKTGNKWAIASSEEGNEFFDKQDNGIEQIMFDRLTGLSSQTYIDLTSNGTSAAKAADSSRNDMQNDKDDLAGRVAEWKRGPENNVGQLSRSIEIETGLINVKSKTLTRNYIHGLVGENNTTELDPAMQTLILNTLPGMMIKVSNLTDKIQRQAVKKDTGFLRYINSPSDEVIRYAVKTNPFVLSSLKPEILTVDHQKIAADKVMQFVIAGKTDTGTEIDFRNFNYFFEDLGDMFDGVDQSIYNSLLDTYQEKAAKSIAIFFVTHPKARDKRVIARISEINPNFGKALS